MKNDKYWQKRFKQLEKAQHKKGIDAYQQIENQYREAERTLEGQISAWYQRFADNNEITLAEARSYLKGADLKEFKWDVNDYIRYGEENAVDGRWMKELENASAKYHISKLEALKIETQNSLEDMYAKQLDTVTTTMQNVYESEYYHTAYEVQKGLGVGWDFAGLNQSEIEKVISKPWAVDGVNFSDRIWDNKEKLISTLHNELTQNIMLGQDPQKAIDAVAKAMNTSKNNAGRLVMTEEAYFSSAAQGDCYRDLGVEEFEIVATLDSHTSEICQEMDGQHFPMKDYQAGVTAPPFHPWCRSTTVPAFGDEFDNIGTRAARDEETGKTYQVPGNCTYDKWEKAFVEGDKSVLQEIEKNAKIDSKSTKEPGKLLKSLKDSKIEYREVKKLPEALTEEQIIAKLGGGDETHGSCGSLAYAYMGNKAGFDVTDYRGGDSMAFFSSKQTVAQLLELDGAKGAAITTKNEIRGAMGLLKDNTVVGKEYCLSVGKHRAIVRRVNDSSYEYLELQTPNSNGWHDLNDLTLKSRFGATKSRSLYGEKLESPVRIIDVDSLTDNDEFRQILGYLNTAEDKQKKGGTGHAR